MQSIQIPRNVAQATRSRKPGKWNPSNLSKTLPMRSHNLEFQDNTGEWHHFTIQVTPRKIVFGGVCNCGFLESGYIVRERFEHIDATLAELLSDLETYYNDGPRYVSRIVHNERM